MFARLALATLLSALAVACAGSEALPEAERPPQVAVSPTAYVPTAGSQRSPTIATPTGEPVASTAAAAADSLPTVQFVSNGRVLGILPVEVLPQGEFSVGLSGRSTLGERAMLFDYGKPGNEGPFWMKDTHFDLDIAFIDDAQRIVSIRTMRAESLEYVYSAAPYRSALETPAGWFAARGIREGDLVGYVPPRVPTP